MDWTTVDFSSVSTEVVAMLTDSNIIVAALSLFALILGVKLAPRIIKYFAR